jgi:hypothetical protein
VYFSFTCWTLSFEYSRQCNVSLNISVYDVQLYCLRAESMYTPFSKQSQDTMQPKLFIWHVIPLLPSVPPQWQCPTKVSATQVPPLSLQARSPSSWREKSVSVSQLVPLLACPGVSITVHLQPLLRTRIIPWPRSHLPERRPLALP